MCFFVCSKVVLLALLVFLATFNGCRSKEIFVSPRGNNTLGCGTRKLACQTIKHVFQKIAKSHDIIRIDGGSGDIFLLSRIWIDERQFNMTFTSYNGKAKIRHHNSYLLHPVFLYIEPMLSLNTAKKLTATVKNLEFYNIALAEVINNVGIRFTEIRVENCLFKNDHKAKIDDSYNGIILITVIYSAIVKIKNCTVIGVGTEMGFIALRDTKYCPARLYITIESSEFYDPSFVIYSPLENCRTYFFGTPFHLFQIKDSIFKGNPDRGGESPLILTTTFQTKNDHILAQVLIDGCQFENIHSARSAAILGARGSMSVNITNSTFVQNYGHWGGALSFEVSFARIERSTFVENKVLSSDDINLVCSGGAFAASGLTMLIVRNSTFTDNQASCFGHSIYAANCRNITVSDVKLESRKQQLCGELWHSDSNYLHLDGFHVSLSSSQKGTQSLFHARSGIIETGRQKPSFFCPIETNISVSYLEPKTNTTGVTCTHCPDKSYSSEYSYGAIGNFRTPEAKLHYIKCQQCPFGADCHKNIVPKSNYWGYTFGGLAHIISCLPGYCCQGAGECKQLNSCHGKRKGVLCGQCQAGYAQNIFSNECIKNSECNGRIFWTVFFTLAVVFVVIISYLQDIFKLIFGMLNLQGLLEMFEGSFTSRKRLSSTRQHRELDDDEEKEEEEEEEEETISGSEKTVFLSTNNSKRIQNGLKDDKNQASINSTSGGLIKIIFFYYQVNALLILYKSEIHSNVIHNIHQTVINIFNLQPNHSKLATFGCALANSSTMLKTVLKSIFPLLMLSVAALLLSITFAISHILRHYSVTRYVRSFNNRLLVAILQIILLGYSTMTSNIFSLLTCVSMADGSKILYIDGGITCYQSWQYAALAFVIVWTLPLVYALYAAPKYLQRNALSVRGFYLALVFPLPFLCYSIFKDFIQKSKASFQLKEQDSDGYYRFDSLTKAPTNQQNETENPRKQLKGQLLNVLGSAFRAHDRQKKRIAWEPVLIAQRLILLCVHTFLVNPVLKAIALLFAIVFVAFLNIAVQPFHSKFLNIVNFIFISFLCTDAIINSLRAYVYIGGTMLDGPLFDILAACDYIEIATILVFPSVAVLAYVILLLARICHVVYSIIVAFRKCVCKCCLY